MAEGNTSSVSGFIDGLSSAQKISFAVVLAAVLGSVLFVLVTTTEQEMAVDTR